MHSCMKFPIKITRCFTPTLLLQDELTKKCPGDQITMSNADNEMLNPQEHQLTQKGYFTFKHQT